MRPYVIGLTGSVGMGKSTTAAMFADFGIPVWDADAAVHRLYSKGGAAIGPIGVLYPAAIIQGEVNRSALKAWIAKDPGALKKIESVVHPLVAQDRADFLQNCDEKIALVDVPLLFETGGERSVDFVAVVTTSAQEQRKRVLARPGMTKELFATILAKQLPDGEKRKRADYVIRTDTPEGTRDIVRALIGQIEEKLGHA